MQCIESQGSLGDFVYPTDRIYVEEDGVYDATIATMW